MIKLKNIESIGRDFFNEYAEIFYSLSGKKLKYEGTDSKLKIYFSVGEKIYFSVNKNDNQLVAQSLKAFLKAFPQQVAVQNLGENWYSFTCS